MGNPRKMLLILFKVKNPAGDGEASRNDDLGGNTEKADTKLE